MTEHSETFEWESFEWAPTRQWLATHLGEEWADAQDFFGRMVGHLAFEAAPVGDVTEQGAHELREKMRAQLPKTLDEIVPFAARYVWDKGLTPETRGEFFKRLKKVASLAGAQWEIGELEARVHNILT